MYGGGVEAGCSVRGVFYVPLFCIPDLLQPRPPRRVGEGRKPFAGKG